jgi:hypothetical protein
MGYVHDTGMAQYIPPDVMHYVTGTWADAAGQVAGTICKHKTANAETAVVTIPVKIPSNSAALKGAKLVSIEVDYEILIGACTSVTPVLNKVTRGADTAVAVVGAVTQTMNLVAGTTAATVDQHRMIVTLTTPAWIDNDEYYLLAISAVCAGGTVLEFLGAVANFTLRV